MTAVSIERKCLIVFAATFGYATTMGLVTTLPLLYTEWLETFGKSRAETAVAQSVCSGVFNTIGFLFGILVTKFGPRLIGILSGALSALGFSLSFFATSINYLTFIFGILAGFGMGGVFLCSGIVVGRYIEGKQKHIALSIMSFGGSTGAMGFTYIIDKLSLLYGWRGCMLIIGAIVFHNIPLFAMCRQLKSTDSPNNYVNAKTLENEQKHEKAITLKIKKISKNLKFHIYLLAISCVIGSTLSTLVIIVDFFHFSGFSRDDSVLLFLIMSIVSTVTRIVIGLLKQLDHVSVFAINLFNAAVGTIALLVFPSVKSFAGIAALIGCLGICTAGVLGSVVHMTILRIVGLEHFPIAVGMTWSIVGICRMLGGPITGYLRDVTGLYDASFYANGGISCFGVVTYAVLFYICTSKSRSSVKISERNIEMSDKLSNSDTVDNVDCKSNTLSSDVKGKDNQAFEL